MGFNLSEWALRHQPLVRYLIVALAIVGVLSYEKLGQSEDPPFTFKVMVVRTEWSGASAREVEEQLTDRIEKKLQEVPYVDTLRSYSRPGESVVLFIAKDSTPVKDVPDICSIRCARRSATSRARCPPASAALFSTMSSGMCSAISTR
jgi:multidrug efflux pump